MKYVVLNNETTLPVGSAKTVKAANELADALDLEAFDVIGGVNYLEDYKMQELVAMYNATADEPVKKFKTLKEGRARTYEAMAAYNFEADGAPKSKAKPSKPAKKAKRGSSKLLEAAVIKMHPTGGMTRHSVKSSRHKVKELLVEFMGRKQSVVYGDFKATLPQDLQTKLPGIMRQLAGCGHVLVTVERGDDVENWVGIFPAVQNTYDKRQAKAAEDANKESAGKKKAKAKKK